MTFIPVKSIVKLKKGAYDTAHTDYKCDLLVTISRNDEDTVVVRYPDTYATRVSKEDILVNSMCIPGHPGYNARLLRMSAFEFQFISSEPYRKWLELNNPEVYTQASNLFLCKTEEPNPEPEVTEPMQQPTGNEILPYLKSIDEKLGILINFMREVNSR